MSEPFYKVEDIKKLLWDDLKDDYLCHVVTTKVNAKRDESLEALRAKLETYEKATRYPTSTIKRVEFTDGTWKIGPEFGPGRLIFVPITERSE